MGRIVPVAVLLTIAGGAAGNSSSYSSLAATPTAAKLARLSCPRLSGAARLPYRPGGGRLRGDIDGDGRLDRISIRYSPAAPASCGIVLVVETRAKVFALPVAWEYKPGFRNVRARDVWTPEPYLAAIVQLDPRRSQLVIARNHGASNAFVNFVGIVDGKLVLLPFRPRVYADELSLFGSVGVGVTNARCRRGGPLVVVGIGADELQRQTLVLQSHPVPTHEWAAATHVVVDDDGAAQEDRRARPTKRNGRAAVYRLRGRPRPTPLSRRRPTFAASMS